MIVSEAYVSALASSNTIVSAAPNCGITYDRHLKSQYVYNTGHISVAFYVGNIIYLVTKQATLIRRSSVLSLPFS
jgi:hypothetical protein